jgi:hypothetical protein
VIDRPPHILHDQEVCCSLNLSLGFNQNSIDMATFRAYDFSELLGQVSRSQRVLGMGALLSLCTRLLGAIALAIRACGSATPGTRRRGAVALLGGIGILAFVLSTISITDNGFQHRHSGGRKLFRVSGRALGRVSADGIPSHTAVSGPVAKPHLPRPERITSLCIATISLPGRFPCTACASRAPPLSL